MPAQLSARKLPHLTHLTDFSHRQDFLLGCVMSSLSNERTGAEYRDAPFVEGTPCPASFDLTALRLRGVVFIPPFVYAVCNFPTNFFFLFVSRVFSPASCTFTRFRFLLRAPT